VELHTEYTLRYFPVPLDFDKMSRRFIAVDIGRAENAHVFRRGHAGDVVRFTALSIFGIAWDGASTSLNLLKRSR